jgi:hypothetical protein
MITVLDLILKGEKLSQHLKNYIHVDRKFKSRPIPNVLEEGEIAAFIIDQGLASVSTEASSSEKTEKPPSVKKRAFSPKDERNSEPTPKKKPLHREANMSFLLEKEDSNDYEKDPKIKKTPPKSEEEQKQKTPETPEEKRKKLMDIETVKNKVQMESMLDKLLEGKPSQPRVSSNLEELFRRDEQGRKVSKQPEKPKGKHKLPTEDSLFKLFAGSD